MKRLMILLLLLPMIGSAQAVLYVPAGPGFLKAIPLQPGINVLQDFGGTMQTPTPVVVVAGALLATPNTAVGDQALADCQAGKVPPQTSMAGIPNCVANQTNAINADILARVKSALFTLPSSTLTNYGLQVVQ